ncbi:MAG: hypothetical protein DI582_10980 [Azospirillum brasilense]|nr:MAG: hypothetical protein DI582_10980 [Azospirillum brasilense]
MSVVAWYRDFTAEESEEITDKSGNGNTGVLTTATVTAVAAKGRVLSFPPSVTSAVEVADSDSLSPTSVSVGAWIYHIDNSAAMVVDKNLSYRLWFPDGDGVPAWDVYVGGSWHSVFAPTPVPTQQWVFLQGSYDGANSKLFVQGVEKASSALTGDIEDSADPLLLGKFLYGGYQFTGYLGEVLVKDTGVSLAEHKNDLQRWLKKETHNLIELLQIKVPGNPINVCTYSEEITVTVYE